MGNFELSFKNKYVRAWFYTVLPALIISVILVWILPQEWIEIPTFIPVIVALGYFVWLWYDLRKQKKEQ